MISKPHLIVVVMDIKITLNTYLEN